MLCGCYQILLFYSRKEEAGMLNMLTEKEFFSGLYQVVHPSTRWPIRRSCATALGIVFA